VTAPDPGWKASRAKRWQAALIGALGYPALGALGRTWRWRVEGEEHFAAILASGHYPVMALWHGRIFPSVFYFRHRDVVVITSDNFDGEWTAKIIHRLGYTTARGSTSRNAVRAALRAKRRMEEGHPVGITVDGPRGPAMVAQPGAVWMAKVTGNPRRVLVVLDRAQLGRVADSVPLQPHRDGDGRALLRSGRRRCCRPGGRARRARAPFECAETEGAGPPGGLMLVVSSPRFADHLTPPGHPESPERADVLEAVAARAKARGEEVAAPRAATREEVLRVHTASHFDAIEAARGHASMIDADTFTSPDTADVALLAAGAAVEAVEAVLVAGDRPHRAAAALVRPPGHHAEPDRAMGFCFYNNVAVAAAHARSRGVSRVAVLDYDVHHGNGTQAMFYADPSVLYISTHQFPFYPGTGGATEIGERDGRGFTVNLPIEAGASDGDSVRVFQFGVLPVLEEFRPGLLLISAGFDAHEMDPLAQMRMTSAGFAWMTSELRAMADRVSEGRVVLVTEGGYALPALGESLDLALGALAGDDDVPAAAALRPATGRGDRALAALAAAQAGQWHGL
jgi:acetoin utilization deacetylase AcuC-like enzyme/lysophospholipid acyltransferase (LPLAT)-like uncharacterized protein